MKAEFRALELILESPYVYVERREEDNGGNRIDIWDSVHEAMTVLKNKIDEVEKRMECARRFSIEINGTISEFADRLDKGLPVGVIQLHDDGDCSTDMFGNTSTSEAHLATLSEIIEFRPNIVSDLEKQ